jgi:hypothetical protein
MTDKKTCLKHGFETIDGTDECLECKRETEYVCNICGEKTGPLYPIRESDKITALVTGYVCEKCLTKKEICDECKL